MQERITAVTGNIVALACDAIVNAANTSLLGGGGVDGAIHRFGGSEILDDCRKIIAKQGGCKTGEAVITTAGKLPAKFVIHTVGPVWNAEKQAEMAELLANCYKNSLQLAVENECKIVHFPCISTGVYKYPKHLAAEVAVKTVQAFLAENDTIEKVVFVCFDYTNFRYYMNFLKG